MHSLMLFAYYREKDGKPAYRDALLKFLRMDLNGEVDSANPHAAFEKAFCLDEAGWDKFDADFLAWQKGD